MDGEIDRFGVMFVVEEQTFGIADLSRVSDVGGAESFMAAGPAGIVFLTLFLQ